MRSILPYASARTKNGRARCGRGLSSEADREKSLRFLSTSGATGVYRITRLPASVLPPQQQPLNLSKSKDDRFRELCKPCRRFRIRYSSINRSALPQQPDPPDRMDRRTDWQWLSCLLDRYTILYRLLEQSGKPPCKRRTGRSIQAARASCTPLGQLEPSPHQATYRTLADERGSCSPYR